MWLSVHSGIFVVQRSINKKFLMAKDQSHAHSNRQLEAGGGGVSDLYIYMTILILLYCI